MVFQRILNIEAIPEPEPADFVKKFKKQPVDTCLVVLGSMYLVGEIKSAL